MIFVNNLPLSYRLILALAVGLFSTLVLFGVYSLPLLLKKLRTAYSAHASGT